MSKTIPFRNDIVGSFLRPAELKKAREDFANGKITREELTKVEDRLIIDLIAKEKANGLKAVTDGEFRRRWWHLDFIEGVEGITKFSLGDIKTFQNTDMKNAESYYVSGKLKFPENHPFIEHFKFVKEHAGDAVAKQTIAGPNMIYATILTSPKYKENPAYATLEEARADIIQVYKDAIKAFYNAGCRYLQFDDTSWGALFSESGRENYRKAGHDPSEVIKTFADITEACIADKPEDMAITIHICRGNFKSSWLYEGHYDVISEKAFAIEKLDGFFLEYDDERSGGFEPLRHLKNQKIVLGLITSKRPELEDIDALVARVKDAAKYVPLSQICVSPQCGFASTEEGNSLTEEEQWAKIRLVTALAAEIEKI